MRKAVDKNSFMNTRIFRRNVYAFYAIDKKKKRLRVMILRSVEMQQPFANHFICSYSPIILLSRKMPLSLSLFLWFSLLFLTSKYPLIIPSSISESLKFDRDCITFSVSRYFSRAARVAKQRTTFSVKL